MTTTSCCSHLASSLPAYCIIGLENNNASIYYHNVYYIIMLMYIIHYLLINWDID